MQKSIAGAAVVALVMLAVPAVGAPQKQNAGPLWPMGLGDLASVPRRFPSHDNNAAAARLKLLGARVGLDFTPGTFREDSLLDRRVLDFLEAQIARPDDRIDPLPAEVDSFFRKNEPHIDAVRDHLLAAPIAWAENLEHPERAPLPNWRSHALLARVLVARALARSSWNDLRAAERLSRALSPRPELTSQIVASSIERLVLAAARKMPAPVPPWAGELTGFDARPGIISAIQVDAWWLQQEIKAKDESTSVDDRLEDIILRPFDELFATGQLDLLRDSAADLAQSRQCAFDGHAFQDRMRAKMSFWNRVARDRTPNLGSIWQRVARLTAERELTANILAVRSGRAPQLKSSCSDGSWTVKRDAAGTHLRFSRPIPVRHGQSVIPLEYTVK